jgi:hypothetical protein
MSAIILLVLRLLIAALLYGFIGVVIYILWRDLKHQGELLVTRQPIPITLTTLIDSPPFTRHYTCSQVILGRESTCDFPINDQTVSSQHTRLTYRQSQWWCEDMASTNGTLLNGEPVLTPVVLTNGDELRLGQVGVRIALGERE